MELVVVSLAVAVTLWLLLTSLKPASWIQLFRRWTQPHKVLKHDAQGKDDGKTVTALTDFDFTKEPPRPYRPFLTRTHVAMVNDWIQIDSGYLERLDERITTMNKYPQDAIGVNDESAAAILELFKLVIIDHVPRRFPTMFKLEGTTFTNLITNKVYDVEAASRDPVLALKALCENVEEDFYFMCPDGQGEWRFQGYIACFPGGFFSPSRVGMSFREIHQPVPHYNERIANGVDRFARRMQGGDLIQRFNWSLQVDGKDLFRLDGNNFYPELGHTLPDGPEQVDLDDCWLRCERQSLKCLEHSGAIVFCVRSYMTSLYDIVSEGNGAELADAIDSMPEKLGHYKKRPFWENTVQPFLRQDVN